MAIGAGITAAMPYIAIGTMAAGATYGAYSSYQQGKENASNIMAQAKLQASEIQRQAAAQAEAQNAAAREADRRSAMDLLEANNQAFQAGEELRQGEIAQERANLEQVKGEREAAKRSRLLAQEIGQQYANFAANGIAVDASPTDTVGSVIMSTAAEGQADISTILENAELNQWTYEEQKRTMRRSAANTLAGANNSVFKAQSDAASAADARKAAATTLANGRAAAADTLAYGRSAAKAARRSGVRGMWGSLLTGSAQIAGFADRKWGS